MKLLYGKGGMIMLGGCFAGFDCVGGLEKNDLCSCLRIVEWTVCRQLW